MFEQLRRNWWAIAVRGIAAIAFASVVFAWPKIKIAVLVTAFAACAIVEGVFAIVSSVLHRTKNAQWWIIAIEGFVGTAAGVLAFAIPGLSAYALVLLVAAWALARGVAEVAVAVHLVQEMPSDVWLFLSGFGSIVAGVLLLFAPRFDPLSFLWLIATYALAFGLLMLGLSVWLRIRAREIPPEGLPA